MFRCPRNACIERVSHRWFDIEGDRAGRGACGRRASRQLIEKLRRDGRNHRRAFSSDRRRLQMRHDDIVSALPLLTVGDDYDAVP
jgi:hypothetical protein